MAETHQVQVFPEQRLDEKIQLMVRPFWLVLLPQILGLIFLTAFPIVVLIVLGATGAAPFEGTARNVTVVALPAWYLALVTWAFITWLDFYLDVGIVTDQRVIDIEQLGLFRRNVAELDLEMVQDVAEERKGILQTVFNYGNVVIQTAGERPNFELLGVHKPTNIVQKIGLACKLSEEQSPEQEAAEKLESAAEKMAETADKMDPTTPDQPKKTPPQESAATKPPDPGINPGSPPSPREPTPPAADKPKSNQPDSDGLPREYE